MSELPKGWIVTTLGEINAYSGKTVEPQATPDEVFELYSVPIFSTKKPEVVQGQQIGSTKQSVQPGDVLLCKINPRINRVWQVSLKGAHDQICSSEWIVIRQPLINPDFLQYQLSEQSFRERLCAEVSGVGGSLTRAQPKKVAGYDVFLAPLAEQTRIAAKLDELLAQVDTLKARIDGIPALLKRFRQTVLAAAVSGRLTEEWRGLPSDGLTKSDSHDMPAGWSVIPLGSYASNHDGARKPISAKERESRKGDHPYFGATGQIDRIDGYTHDGEFILVGEDGANLLTRVKPIAFIANGQIWVNNHAHVIASPSGHSNAYLAIYLNTLDITPWVSGSAQPKLNQKNMNEIPVHVPPSAEQTEIVRRVEQLFAFADQLEARVVAAQARIDRLTQSILAKAFRGELVPQDPNDEPASVLLERIKAQRAAAPKVRRGRRAATLS